MVVLQNSIVIVDESDGLICGHQKGVVEPRVPDIMAESGKAHDDLVVQSPPGEHLSFTAGD